MAEIQAKSLRIVHCFRSPVGGVFRHVRDLAEAQNAAGHSVGILCDSSTGGELEDQLFESIRPHLKLGLKRIPMRRAITPADLMSLWNCYRQIRAVKPDVLHAHGAKGGVYARVIGTALRLFAHKVTRLYCPHGGAMHYDRATLNGRMYFAVERFLELMTDRLVFVSEYERDAYEHKVGTPRCPHSLIYNGLKEEEFLPVPTKKGAADFIYIGMMRDLKGPDIFLKALALARETTGKNLKAHFVGDGPDKNKYIQMIQQLGLEESVRVHDAMPARLAFTLGKIIVVPSRAESMPYLVLEAIAASRPIIATSVGGIPEIFGSEAIHLVEPDDEKNLSDKMCDELLAPISKAELADRKERLHERFSIKFMANAVEDAYSASP